MKEPIEPWIHAWVKGWRKCVISWRLWVWWMPTMADIQPFAALRPKSDLAHQICQLPYDVMSSDEAREMAAGNPMSFLHVSKPEIDLPPETDPYSDAVYEMGAQNLQKLIDQGALFRDDRPKFYLYRQIMGSHSQTGLVAAASCQDYMDSVIKKHEFTRPDKENDRVRHIDALNAQTGPVFLTYKATAEVDALFEQITSGTPDVDFQAEDAVRHTSWTIEDAKIIGTITAAFAAIPTLYIADGHHRSAAAARVFKDRKGADGSSHFLTVIFPDHQMQILAYNRAIKDLNGLSPSQLLDRLDLIARLIPQTAAVTPEKKHQFGLYLSGQWYLGTIRDNFLESTDPIELLDVTLLQRHILDPILGIDDPRTSKRIAFIGGIRGTRELEKIVNSGEYSVSISMFPTSIHDLMRVADNNGIMPPKSTWFEPKLRDAMFSYILD